MLRRLSKALLVASASSLSPPANAHAALRSVRVLETTSGAAVGLTEQWTKDERAVLVLMRSFG